MRRMRSDLSCRRGSSLGLFNCLLNSLQNGMQDTSRGRGEPFLCGSCSLGLEKATTGSCLVRVSSF
jgi:hypothetical protein